MTGIPLFDTDTPGIRQLREVRINDWDEVSEWASRQVAPIRLVPLEHSQRPDGVVHSIRVGRIGITRTAYGKPAQVSVEGYSGAPVVATTNIRGHARPQLDGREPRTNGRDMSFVFDLSQGSHQSQLSEDNVQLQLAFDPGLLDEIGRNWFGTIPDRKSWQFRTSFGGAGTSWHACLHYVMRLIAEAPRQLSGRKTRHIEETLGANMLENWAAQAGLDLDAEEHVIVPRIIRMAEDYMVEHAADAPTLAEIAGSLDVSVRNLTLNFRKFRGCTPGQFLREQRLQAARKRLLAGGQGVSVSQVAAGLSYVHMGEFAKAYRARFGERPSETLKRAGS